MVQAVIVIVIGAVISAALFLVLRSKQHATAGTGHDTADKQAKTGAESVFADDFREELRNRGRLYFEKTISESAMFLQQDLRLTSAQMNDYMKTEITRRLQEEFGKYEQAIGDAKDLAVDSIKKTSEIIEAQRQALSSQLSSQLDTEKTKLIGRFETDMADIINHYVLSAVGNQIDLSDQLEYIIGELEANKKAIAEDIRSAA